MQNLTASSTAGASPATAKIAVLKEPKKFVLEDAKTRFTWHQIRYW